MQNFSQIISFLNSPGSGDIIKKLSDSSSTNAENGYFESILFESKKGKNMFLIIINDAINIFEKKKIVSKLQNSYQNYCYYYIKE